MTVNRKPLHLLHGQLVEVRSYHEIAQTLDAEGKLEGLPFMPEMARFCGVRIHVARRADKTCVAGGGIRKMNSTVFLQDLRCDGGYHDGCQRGCLLFWKEAWLKPVEANAQLSVVHLNHSAAADKWIAQLQTRRNERYTCQSTELYQATDKISRWSILPFMREMRNGELSFRGFIEIAYRTVRTRFFKLPEFGTLVGTQKKTHQGDLNLRAGEVVDIKGPKEIQAALNSKGKNCGLALTPSMAIYLGGRHEVAFPVKKIINEASGEMVNLSNTVALKGVTCSGPCVKNCPRSEYHYWRESWLQRADIESLDHAYVARAPRTTSVIRFQASAQADKGSFSTEHCAVPQVDARTD
jgi:hypothetical protein